MKEQAQIIQLKKQEQESPFICSACGADRGCDCNAPAVKKMAEKYLERNERERQRLKEKRAVANAPVENIDESSKALNAVGKPYSPQYDPGYKLKTQPPSVNRLYGSQKNIPMVGDAGAPAAPLAKPPALTLRSHDLIEALTDSTPATRAAAVQELASGSRQSEFEAVTLAVSDLYERISKVGR